MSVQSARAFVEKLISDQTFSEKLAALPTNEAKLKAIKEAGFDFTWDEFEKLLPPGVTLTQLGNLKPGDEVPDEVLEAVAGGKDGPEEGDGAAFAAMAAASCMA